MKEANKTSVRRLYPRRDALAHKGDFGNVLIIGGSKLYSGSPAFSALAALCSGADLVRVAAPQRAADIVAGVSPDLITWPLKGDAVCPAHLKEVFSLLEGMDSVVIGGGTGRSAPSLCFVRRFLEKNTLPVVVDADAIHAVRGIKLKPGTILTPHTREFQDLTGSPPPQPLKQRAGAVKKAAKTSGCTVLLKGHIDIISDGKNIALNRTGTPFMTKGGTGDTLAGIAGALLARGAKPFEAACAAAWINGRAGELAGRESGEGLLASDLLTCIPKALKF